MASIAGCGVLGSCGPGETKIETLAKRAKQDDDESEKESESSGSETTEELPRIVGTIEKAERSEVIVEDGTGRASLQTLGGGFQIQNVGKGDCAYAKGFPIEPDDGTDADVTIIVTEIGIEE